MIKVSVIIPIYNAQVFLRESLDCLVNQTLKDIEIICVDDGSTDDTGTILSKYADKDKRIKVITQENQEAGAARNRGLKEATGEYIAFFDCDDIYEQNMLEKMYHTACTKKLDVIVCRSDKFKQNTGNVIKCNWTIRDELLPPKEVFSSNDVEKNFFMTFVWWPWDKLYRRYFILEQGLEYQNLRTTNDLYFVSCAVMVAKRVAWIDEVLVHHRIGSKSSLSVTREKSWDNFYIALCAVKEFLKERNMYSRFERDYINYCVHFSVWNLETVWGKSFALLYNQLQNEWYDELGISKAREDIFYNEAYYRIVKYMLSNSVSKIESINSNRIYQTYIKFNLFCVGYGILETLKKIKTKLPEYI